MNIITQRYTPKLGSYLTENKFHIHNEKANTGFFRLPVYYTTYGCFKPKFRKYLSVPFSRVKPYKEKLEDGTDR
jgi:hypothetical protein